MARKYSDNQLCNQRFDALSGAAKLGDKEPAAVRIDYGGKRSAFTKRLNVSGCRENGQRCKTQMTNPE